MSLAAVLGFDARVLLATDDPATHAVYDRVIEQTRLWSIEATRIRSTNLAIAIVNTLGEAFGRKR